MAAVDNGMAVPFEVDAAGIIGVCKLERIALSGAVIAGKILGMLAPGGNRGVVPDVPKAVLVVPGVIPGVDPAGPDVEPGVVSSADPGDKENNPGAGDTGELS